MTNTNTYDFFKLVINTVEENIVVIDKNGKIIFVNDSWKKFAEANNAPIKDDWSNYNYLKVCDNSAKFGDEYARRVAKGIRKVLNKEESTFNYEYPCHGNNQERWFLMRVTPFAYKEMEYFVLSHHNITDRYLSEQRVLKLSLKDALTDIPNRRAFNEFLDKEWRRCKRSKTAITLAILDIDYFKLLNDRYGHQVGDDSLQKIARVFKRYIKRASDMYARYGGEEFAFVFGNSLAKDNEKILLKIKDKIEKLKIPNEDSNISDFVTVSIGVSTLIPNNQNTFEDLIRSADMNLYRAKDAGRNKIIF